GIKTHEALENAGEEKHAGADVFLFVELDRHFQAAGESAPRVTASAANDPPRAEPRNPLDQLPRHIGQLLLPGLRIAEVVEPEDFTQSIASFGRIVEREIIERQMRDK